MKTESHREKIDRIADGVAHLDPDRSPDLLVEAAFGIALNALAVMCETGHGSHLDVHAGLYRFLKERKLDEEARLFLELTELRAGAWYGNRATPGAARRSLAIASDLRGRLESGPS